MSNSGGGAIPPEAPEIGGTLRPKPGGSIRPFETPVMIRKSSGTDTRYLVYRNKSVKG
jgi:hypothetical protein